MAKFSLTAQIQLQAPKNASQIVNQIQQQLSGVNVSVNLQNASQAVKQINQITSATNNASNSAKRLGDAFGVSLKRFATFSIASRGIGLFTSKLSAAIEEAISFQNEIVRLSQVTDESVRAFGSLTNQITRLSTSIGVSSKELLGVATILAQAGLNARDTEIAVNALAKTALAPTFGDIKDTAEGAVAVIAQFGEGVGALERQLGAINEVAAKFAVESEDLIAVIRRTGGVFKASGGSLEELLALFTSVRATTRESAESIATGLRTIFTRIQRPQTIEYLKRFGIELTDLEGKFIGPYEAIRQLSEQLSGLEEGDVRFIQIAEELGGYRQIGKVIPLLRQFEIAEKARQAALAGGESLDKDVANAQQSLAVQFTKVREEFLALIRSISETSSFQILVKSTLSLTSNLIGLADALKPIIPLLTAFAAIKFASNIGGFFQGIGAGFGKTVGPRTKNAGGRIYGFASGGLVPGTGNRDTVPAMLSPGEFVIRKSSVNKIGAEQLAAMNENRYATGGKAKIQIKDNEIGAFFLNPAKGQDVDGNVDTRIDVKNPNIARKLNLGLTEEEINLQVFTNATKKDQGRLLGDPDLVTSGKIDADKLKNKRSKPYQSFIDENTQKRISEFAASRSRNKKQNARINSIPVSLVGTVEGFFTSNRDLQKSSLISNIISQSTESGLKEAIKKASGEASKILEGIDPLDPNEAKVAEFAQRNLFSRKGGSALDTIEGYVFEGLISSLTGAKIAGGTSAFDFPSMSSPVKNKLSQLFDNPDVTKLSKADAKRTYTSGILKSIGKGSIPSKIEQDLAEGKTKGLSFTPKASGGNISGSDTVPALLTPGEFVINRKSAQNIGYGNLNRMNKRGVTGFATGGPVGVQKFANGGKPSALAQSIIGGNADVKKEAAAFKKMFNELVSKGLTFAEAFQIAQKQFESLGPTTKKFKSYLEKQGQRIIDLPAGAGRASGATAVAPAATKTPGAAVATSPAATKTSGAAAVAGTKNNNTEAANKNLGLLGDKATQAAFLLSTLGATLGGTDTAFQRVVGAITTFGTSVSIAIAALNALTGSSGIKSFKDFLGFFKGGTSKGTLGGLISGGGGFKKQFNAAQVGNERNLIAKDLNVLRKQETRLEEELKKIPYRSIKQAKLQKSLNDVRSERKNLLANKPDKINAGDAFGLTSKSGKFLGNLSSKGSLIGRAAGFAGRGIGAIAGSGIGAVGGALASIAGPVAGVVATLGLLSAAISSFNDYQGQYNKAIKEGNDSKAREIAVLKEVPGIVQRAGSEWAEAYQSSIGVLLGGDTVQSIKAKTDAEISAAKYTREYEKNSREAAAAMRDVEAGAMTASGAFKQGSITKNLTNAIDQSKTAKISAQANESNKSVQGSFFGIGRNILSTVGLADSVSTRNAKIDEENKKKTKESQEAVQKELDNLSPVFRQITTELTLSGQGIEEFKNRLKEQGITSESVGADAFKELIKDSENQSKAIKDNLDFLKSLDLGLSSVTAKANATSLAMENLMMGSKTGFNSFAKSLAILEASITETGAEISDQDIASSTKNLENTLREFGASDKQIKNTVGSLRALQIAQKEAGSVVQDIANNVQGKNISADPATIVKEFSTRLGERLKAQGVDPAEIQRITTSFEKRAEKLSPEALAKISSNSNLEDVRKELFDPLVNAANEQLGSIYKPQIEQTEKLIKLTEERINLERSAAEARKQAIDIEVEARKAMQEFGGAAFTSRDQIDALNRQLNVDLNLAGLGDVGLGTAGDIGNAQANIMNNFAQQQREDAMSLAGRGEVARGGVLGLEADKTDELRKSQESIVEYSRKRIDILREEISIAQKKNELEKSAVDKLLGGDLQGFIEDRSAAAAATVLRAGDTQLSKLFGGAALGAGLKSLEGQGLSKQQMEKATKTALSGFGGSERMAQVYAGTTPELQALNQQAMQFAQILQRAGENLASMEEMRVEAQTVILNVAKDIKINGSQQGQFQPNQTQNAQAQNQGVTKVEAKQQIDLKVTGLDWKSLEPTLKPFVEQTAKSILAKVKINPQGGLSVDPGVLS